MDKEKELNEENSNDIFTCQDCKKKTPRGEIRKIWKQIPFVKEDIIAVVMDGVSITYNVKYKIS